VARFQALGGPAAGAAAAAFWQSPSPAHAPDYLCLCGPLYTRGGAGLPDTRLAVVRPEVMSHFFAGEQRTFDLRTDLSRAACPVLVLAGEHDPVCPIESAEELVAHLPPGRAQFERFANSGHGVFHDEPERALEVIRRFITL
jgi:proline iminopeptidase